MAACSTPELTYLAAPPPPARRCRPALPPRPARLRAPLARRPPATAAGECSWDRPRPPPPSPPALACCSLLPEARRAHEGRRQAWGCSPRGAPSSPSADEGNAAGPHVCTHQGCALQACNPQRAGPLSLQLCGAAPQHVRIYSVRCPATQGLAAASAPPPPPRRAGVGAAGEQSRGRRHALAGMSRCDAGGRLAAPQLGRGSSARCQHSTAEQAQQHRQGDGGALGRLSRQCRCAC